MKKNRFLPLMALSMLCLISGCNLVITGPTSSNSSFSSILGPSSNNSSSSSSSGRLPSSSSSPISSSSGNDDPNVISLKALLEMDEGHYLTKGTITSIINYPKQEMMNLYIHDWDEASKTMTSILVQNVPTSLYLAKGNEIKIYGSFKRETIFNDIVRPTLTIQNASDVSIINQISSSEYEAKKYDEASWKQSALYGINNYASIEKLALIDVGSEEDINDNAIKVQAGFASGSEIQIRIDLGDEALNKQVATAFLNAQEANEKVTIKGFIDADLNESGGAFPYLRLTSTSDYQLVKEEIDIPDERTISMYGINDFHGSIVANDANYEAGIIKIGSFLKNKKKEKNTLLINSGDMWQGSIESNYNYGELLTNCMNYIEFDCFALGNHEFDWGQDIIARNRSLAGKDGKTINGYQTPFLAANIYRYDIATKTQKEFANLGQKYVVKTLDNGLKVGIIGAIGYNQITSINSPYVDDLTFLNPVNVIKDLSDELRNDKKVDAVIVSYHGSQSELVGQGITEISQASQKRYVDAVFCAHTHLRESTIENDVPFVQAGCNGRSYGNIELVVDKQGNITCKNYSYDYTSNIVTEIDPVFSEILNPYLEQSNKIANEELGYLNGDLSYNGELVNLVTKAMALQSKLSGYDIDYAISNSGRATLTAGNINHGAVYRSLPFDNTIYIIDVKGSEIRNELKYSSNGMYRLDKEALQNNKIYRIATIDYLAFHRNTNRDYNYFPSLSVVGILTKEGYDIYNYRDITCDYLKSLNGTINAGDYSSSLNEHNKSLLDSKI